jgi:alanine-alpha-ketoisovalerate/valine-pyruvate aminotransferase
MLEATKSTPDMEDIIITVKTKDINLMGKDNTARIPSIDKTMECISPNIKDIVKFYL